MIYIYSPIMMLCFSTMLLVTLIFRKHLKSGFFKEMGEMRIGFVIFWYILLVPTVILSLIATIIQISSLF